MTIFQWFFLMPSVIIIAVNTLMFSLKSTADYRFYVPSITAFIGYLCSFGWPFLMPIPLPDALRDATLSSLGFIIAWSLFMGISLYYFNRKEMKNHYYEGLTNASAIKKGFSKSIAFFIYSVIISACCLFGYSLLADIPTLLK
ncbi:MAG: hypothetical protein ACM3PP_05980 [Candidatus Saccharibacteria bacterium]